MTKADLPTALTTHIEALISSITKEEGKFYIERLLPSELEDNSTGRYVRTIPMWPTYYTIYAEGTVKTNARKIEMDNVAPYHTGAWSLEVETINIGSKSGNEPLLVLLPEDWSQSGNF